MTEDTILIAAASLYALMATTSEDRAERMRMAVARAIKLRTEVKKQLAELELGTQETMWKEKL
jgi:hypothetical protein